VQSERRADHEAALEQLADRGLLYPCTCSRSRVRRAATRAADGGWRYPGTCRSRELPPGGWRASRDPLRLRLPPGRVALADESGRDLPLDPLAALGDPVLLRGDGSIAYHLAVVVDDDADDVTRVVRGRDLAASTAIHRVLQQALGLRTPTYRHHLLLLEEAGGKLAKLHGAVGWRELHPRMSAARLCGLLARAVGLLDEARDVTPQWLLVDFDWERVTHADQLMHWTGDELVHRGAAAGPLAISPSGR
jgi:glutamyl-tRNA synthetase/glutamyl-Q tRNA(Asp) synthetase